MSAPKAKKPSLSELIAVRVSSETAARWRSDADAVGLGLSDLIRSRMAVGGEEAVRTWRRSPRRGLGQAPAPKADPRLVAQLARIGNNLNQIARHANTNRAVDVAMLATLQGVAEQIDDTLSLVALGDKEANEETVSVGGSL